MQKLINEFERINGILKTLNPNEVLYGVLSTERDALKARIRFLHQQGVNR